MSLMKNKVSVVGVMLACACAARPAAAQFPVFTDFDSGNAPGGVTIVGTRTLEFGWSVAGIGDVNADGIDDVASGGPGVTYPSADCGGVPWECPDCDATPGAVHVLFGHPGIGGNGSWSLDAPETHVLRIEGLLSNDQTEMVAPAGDFNNDGVDDFLVGARGASPGGIFLAGAAYLIYGSSTLSNADSFDLNTLDGSNGFVIAGGSTWALIGRGLASIGDFNRDGVDDIAVSAIGGDPPGRPSAGQVYILFGGRGVGESGLIVLPDSLGPKQGIILNGISAGDLAGTTIASAGDFNGDGVSDLVVSAAYPEPQPLAQGQVYVVYGGSDAGRHGVIELADLDGTSGFTLNGPASPPGSSGAIKIGAPSGVGDINADGYGDIGVVVNTLGDWVGIVFGGPNVAADGVFWLANLNGKNGFRVIRGDGNASSVRATPAGDVNNDGFDDLLARVFAVNVVFGGPGVGASGVVDVRLLDGRDGFTFTTGFSSRWPSAGGDVNADGIDDVLGAALHYEDFCDVGHVQILFGRRMGDGDLDADVDLADFARLQACFGQTEGGDVPDACHPFDIDKDNDVDLTDFAAFQELFATPP